MNINDIINSIFIKASPNMINEGEKLFKQGLVNNIKSKKIDKLYHIYGTVEGKGNVLKFNTHLTIDLDTKLLNSSNCSCEEYKEASKYKKDFLCKHLVATNYMFRSVVAKKYSNNNKKLTTKEVGENILCLLEEKINDKREVLSLEIKITYIESKKSPYYEVEFRIGNENIYLINNLEEFIDFKERKEVLRLNNQFVYKPKLQRFNKSDEKIFDFIKEYVILNKQLMLKNNSYVDLQIIKGKTLRILPSSLKRFLQLSSHKKIKIKYGGMEYVASVVLSILPIEFNLKERKDNFILSTYSNKNLPKALIDSGEVYLFDRKIYIPSEESNKIYKILIEQILKYGELRFNKCFNNFTRIMKILNKVTKNINFDEAVKRFYDDISKPHFYIHKKNSHIICSTKINYGNDIVDILKDYDGENLIVRDKLKEEKLVMLLEKLKFIKKKNVFLFMGNEEEDLYELLTNGIEELKRIGIVKLTEDFQQLKVYNTVDINYNLDQTDFGFNFTYSISQIDKNNIKDMYDAFSKGSEFYKIEDKFINLKDDKIKEFFLFVDELDLANNLYEENINIEKNKIIYLEKSIEKNKFFNIGCKEFIKEMTDKIKNINEFKYIVPIELKATLREYQFKGYQWMKSLSYLGFGGILADEMGLGKTLQAITFILSEKNKKSLVITPTSLIYNWVSEINKFAPTIKVAIVHGEKKKRLELIEKLEEFDVILTTYGTLRLDYEFYKDFHFDYCIIDEAQNIKNSVSQNTKRVKDIKAKVKFALTGTPIENNLLELWSIFDFLMPGYLYNKETFEKRFIKTKDMEINELKRLIQPFILRRVKKEVLEELPEKIENKFFVEMTTAQKRLYKAYLKDIKAKLEKDKENKITIFSYLTRLRQLCLDPSILIDNYVGGSGKIKVVIDIINDAIKENKKILIFSQFTSVLKGLSRTMNDLGIDAFYLDGETKANERINLVNSFNESDSIKVFLISLKAGGTGLNLTSANLVIHFDPWWNPAVESQATDRAHRIGQKNSVQVIKLISEGTIEEKIILLQEYKEKLIQDIITNEVGEIKEIKNLTEEEIMYLFE